MRKTERTYASIDLDQDDAVVVDRILETIRGVLMEVALETKEDDKHQSLLMAAVATEIGGRIKGDSVEQPSHADPRELFRDDVVYRMTDNMLRRHADAFARERHKMDSEGRKTIMNIVAEFDTRIGRGT